MQPVVGGPQVPPSMPVAPSPSSGAGHKRMWLFGSLALIVVIVVVAALALHKSPATKSGNSANSGGSATSQLTSQLQLLSHYGSHVQSSNLAQFDKTALFYAVVKNAAMQNVVSVTSDRYEGGDASDQTSRVLEYIRRTTFDYHTKALAAETQDPANSYNVRCVRGKNYTYDNINTMSWQQNDSSSVDCATPTTYVNNISDGFSTGGLSASQAQTFVSAIANNAGLLTVDSASVVTHNNAPYIRLVATVHPVKAGDSYKGMGEILSAFESTGLNSVSWPFDPIGSLATGATFIYYINPATQLPSYSQIGLTYSLDASGHQKQDNIYDFQDTEYTFGGSVQPLSLSSAPTQIKLSWPEEKI